MPIYRTTIAGRTKPFLARADSVAKLREALVAADALTTNEVADALTDGERVWKPGDALPADEAAEAGAGDETATDREELADAGDPPPAKDQDKTAKS